MRKIFFAVYEVIDTISFELKRVHGNFLTEELAIEHLNILEGDSYVIQKYYQ
jgi:hypothetical protein